MKRLVTVVIAVLAAPAVLVMCVYSQDGAIQITADPGWDGTPAWSPNGTQIAFASERAGNADIWVVSAGGGTATQLTGGESVDDCPAWSPDGAWIAFTSNRDWFYMSNVWRVPSNGGYALRVTAPGLDSRRPTWSPDGESIAYSGQALGSSDIWVVPVLPDTVLPSTCIVGNPGDDCCPAWSPDGALIAYSAVGFPYTEQGICVIPASGGIPAQVTSNPEGDAMPAWSPDGEYIAFSRSSEGNVDIWFVRASGGAACRLTSDPGYDTAPAWSPNGTQIAFQSNRSGNFDIWVLTLPSSGVPAGRTDGTTWGSIKSIYK